MRLLDRYIAVTVLRAAGVVGVVVSALSLVSSFIGQADDFASGSESLLGLVVYVVLQLPEHLHLVMPVVAVLGALMGLGGLAAGSELAVIRASGVSIARLGWSVARAGLVLALVTVALAEWLGPRAVQLSEFGQGDEAAGVQSIDGGLWLRESGRTVRVAGILSQTALADITVYRGGAEGGLDAVLHAESARHGPDGWTLHEVEITRFGDDRVEVEQRPELAWDVGLKPEFLRFSVVKAEELSSLGLYRYSNYLARNDVAAGTYRLALWRNLVAPWTVLVLTVFALPFAFGALRGAGAGQRLFLGGLAGLVFFMLNEIAVSAAEVSGLPAWLAASWPTALLALATGVWLWRQR